MKGILFIKIQLKNFIIMNKNIILLGSLILSSAAYSQVGIDTQDPKATLDVVVTADKLNKPFGIIAPRVTGTQ